MFGRKGAPKVDRDPRAPGRLRRAGAWYMGSRVTFVGSLVLGLALLAGAIYLVVVPAPTRVSAPSGGSFDAPAPVVLPTPAAPPAAELCTAQAAVEVMPEVLLSTTFATAWAQADQAVVPESETARPAHLGWPRQCFPRTPEGALYSLATLMNEANAANPQDQLALTEARFSRTGGYQRQVAGLQATGGPVVAGERPQMAILGYRWVGYTPTTATIELQWTYLNGPTADATKAITYQIHWESNDWLVVVPTNRSALYRDGSATRNFVPWGPNS